MESFEIKEFSSFVKTIFQIYGKNAGPMIGITAIVTIPLGMLVLIAVASSGGTDMLFEEPEHLFPLLGIWYVILIPVGIILQALLQGALTHATLQHYTEGRVEIGEAYRETGKRLGSLIGALLISGILVGLMFVIIVGIPFAIYFSVCWTLAFACVMVENKSPLEALSRSRELVRKAWWRTFGYLIGLGIIVFVISLVLSAIPFIGSLISSFVSAPLTGIGATILYLMFREENEEYTPEKLKEELLGGLEEGKEETSQESGDKPEGEGEEG